MKTASWICWLLAVCICLSEAKNKIRRPLLPPYPPTVMLKKSRPIGHRISMGNNIVGSPSHQRAPYKHFNYRIRRPTMFNVLSTGWKNQIRTPLNNRAILPQRVPIKEFHSINKVPEYSPEYRPEPVVLPPTHRGGIDDDKGPIHTIPAPNLSPADRPYDSVTEEFADRHPYPNNFNYHTVMQNKPNPTNFRLTTINNDQPPPKAGTSSPQHQYEVTESNDVGLKEYQAAQPTTFQPQDIDIMRLSTIINPHSKPNELIINHVVDSDLLRPDLQFSQANMPLQKNLHSSLHVGFPSTVVETPYTVVQQVPDLHIGHPASTGPPLSATQLYDLLNGFPHKLTEQYTSDQQHILQQQIGQIFQPDTVTSFSQPQMHSFNYDEQANKLQQQQQQILFNQDYASQGVTTDYNLDPSIDKRNKDLRVKEEVTYSVDGAEQSENNIEYEEMNYQKSPTTYFNKMSNRDDISTKFYTTLPNREAAEKLAALAAAGNVNSRLIAQLRKQQEEDDSIPSNHKNEDDDVKQQQNNDDKKQDYNQQKSYLNSQQHKQSYKVESNEKPSLQITVTDGADYINDNRQNNVRKDNVEYEYENEDGEINDYQFSTLYDERTFHNNDSHIEFGSRLQSKIK